MEGLRSSTSTGSSPTTFTLREPSLDDVFLALTGQRTEARTDEDDGPERRRSARPTRRERRRARPCPSPTGELVMTTAVVAPTVVGRPALDRRRHSRLRWAVADTLTITKRNLIAFTRIPEALFFSTVQPIMFVLLFRYVFGGAIHVPGRHYVDYLMPGIFVQTVAFGAISTSIGLAEDLQKGLIERFRALPMARSAVLAGRTTADLVATSSS